MSEAGSQEVASPEKEEVFVIQASFAQQRLWFLDRLEPGSCAYNLPMGFRVGGPLNLKALERSFDEILRRHESLRTTFSLAEDGELQQVVRPHAPFSLASLSLGSDTEAAREIEIDQFLTAEAKRPFDLSSGPLLRVSLVRLAEEEHLLLIVAHHIIMDGWSGGILVRELGLSYQAFTAGKPFPLSPLKIQYGDFAAWQRNRLQGEALEKLLAFWKKQAGGAATLELPTDRPRGREQTFEGSERSRLIAKPLVDGLKRLAQQSSATLFMVLLAAVDTLLFRYTGQEDITVGTPIAGRTRSELEGLIGFFANTIVLRTDLSGDPSFRQLLARTREMAMDAYSHEELPLEKLIEELKLPRDLGRNPLFQVLVNLQNTSDELPAIPGLSLTPVRVDTGTAKFDLSIGMIERHDGLRVRITYNTHLFDHTTIERMLGHYRVLLEAAVDNPEIRISELPLLTESERQQIVVNWNSTGVDYVRDRCLHQFIEDQVAKTPEAAAVTFETQQLTYRELNAHANQLAHRLRKMGVGPNVLVGICAERSLELIVSLLAIMKAGGAYVPLDPDHPRERLAMVLDDAAPAVLLTQERLLKVLPAHDAPVICLDRDWKNFGNEPVTNPECITSGKDAAYAIFTSGSTGKPKGVPNVHEGIVNRLLWMQHAYRLDNSDRVLQKTPYSFDVSVWEFFWPLMTGACLVVSRPEGHKDPAYLIEVINRQKITTIHFVPSMLSIFLEADGVERCTSLRRMICSGEALSMEVQERFFQRMNGELHNLYGPTEASVDVTYWQCTPGSKRSTIPIGKPIWNTQIYILDKQMHAVPIGVPGELHIGGVCLARGYLNRPQLTAERFVPDPFSKQTGARLYKTGDLARFLADGNIEYLGRLDHQVKLRGFRIELGEIESTLNRHPGIQQSVVVAREDVPGDKRLVGYVIPVANQTIDPSELRAWVKERLPDYMVPAAIVALPEFPLSSNGKVDRKRLPVPIRSSSTRSEAVTPRDEIEASLLKIWQEILKTTSIGITDNFFDLGGHSLLAVRLMNEITKLTGVEIPLTELFQGATIEHLASIVRGTAVVSRVVANPIQQSGDRPPFFAAVLAGMNALGYVPLSKHLGPDQPVYTLQTPGPGPHTTKRPYSQQEYEQVASEYIRAMREIQPNGPYYIGGTCEGARIAFEMTRILESQGQEVNLLAIIDTWVLENTQNRKLWKIYYYSVRLRQFWGQSWKSKGEAVRRAVRNRVQWWLKESAPRKTEWTETYWPGEDFVAARIKSRIAIFKIPKQPFYYHSDPLLGWGSRTTSGVDVQIVPHGRHRLLLREPYVRELAAAMLQSLRRVQSGNGRVLTRDAEQEQPSGVAVVSR